MKNNSTINKGLVYLGIGFPMYQIYSSFGTEKMFPLIAGAVGAFFFYNNFIDKAEIPEPPTPNIGPQESFIPPATWETQNDVPVKRVNPPRVMR